MHRVRVCVCADNPGELRIPAQEVLLIHPRESDVFTVSLSWLDAEEWKLLTNVGSNLSSSQASQREDAHWPVVSSSFLSTLPSKNRKTVARDLNVK